MMVARILVHPRLYHEDDVSEYVMSEACLFTPG